MLSAKQMSLAVVGAAHPNKRGPTRSFEIAMCLPGEAVSLVAEPKNPADQNAITVMSERGVCLGYISADRTIFIRRAWQDGRDVRAIFQAKAPHGAWIRVGFDEEPTLPKAEGEQRDSRSSDEDGFWPDPIYDD